MARLACAQEFEKGCVPLSDEMEEHMKARHFAKEHISQVHVSRGRVREGKVRRLRVGPPPAPRMEGAEGGPANQGPLAAPTQTPV